MRLLRWLARCLVPSSYADSGRPLPPRAERRHGAAGMLDRHELDRRR